MFWHIGRVRGQNVAQVDEYLFTTPGTMGVCEAITTPIDIEFWVWVKTHLDQITGDQNVQREINAYADEVIKSLAQIIIDKKVDLNPIFP